MILCENCRRPATMFKGERPTCDDCSPAGWDGETVRPLVTALPDLSGRKTLRKQEAADALGVSVDYFDKRVMPELHVITRGGAVLVPVDALDRWVKESAARALR